MKKVIFSLLFVLPLAACKPNQKATLTAEVDSLTTVLSQKDSMINDVFASMNTVAENLAAIKTRENIISQKTAEGEIPKGATTQINEDIEAINQLLIQNRETIAKLQRSANQLKQANAKIAGMEKLIAQLNRQVEEKDQEISILKKNLQNMEEKVDQLNTQVSGLNTQVTGLKIEKEALSGEVKSTADELNTVYYIVGSEKELLSKEVVYKRGFIGRTLKINESRSLDNFTRIDLRQLDEVLVGEKKAALVSSHPAGSYDWEMNSDGTFAGLKITDKAKFWEYSKVLVISYK